MTDLIERLRRRVEAHTDSPLGVLLREAADALEEARAEREVIVAEAIKYAGKSGRLEAKVYLLAETLQKLAAHIRPTCSVLWDEAQAALRDHDKENK